MYFKTSYTNPKILLHANDRNMNGRWSAMSYKYLTEKLQDDFNWARSLHDEKRINERTLPSLGYDNVVKRPVILKVCKYIGAEIENKELALKKREVLKAQIEMLNDISSPLLPEPLDIFTVSNKVDGFTDKELEESEPVLVLDYISGNTLPYAYSSQFMRFKVSDNANGKKEYIPNGINLTKICMFISRMVDFLKVLHKNNYMTVGFAPEHILVLNNEIPRLVGLGRICKVKEDGTFDNTHINYGRMIKGYSAPELNQVETNFGENANALAAGVYSLGVILAQMICGDFEVHSETLKNGSIAYPNDKYENLIKERIPEKYIGIHRLLCRLCHPNPDERLVDLEELDLTLKDIGGILMEEELIRLIQIRTILKNSKITKTGKVMSFDRLTSTGTIKLDESGEEIFISSEFLESCNLSYLPVNAKVNAIYKIKDDETTVLQKIWVPKKESNQTQTTEIEKNNKEEYTELTPIRIIKTMVVTAKVIEFNRERNAGVIELEKTQKRIPVTGEVLASSNLSYLLKDSYVNVTVEHLSNGSQRPVRVSLKKIDDGKSTQSGGKGGTKGTTQSGGKGGTKGTTQSGGKGGTKSTTQSGGKGDTKGTTQSGRTTDHTSTRGTEEINDPIRKVPTSALIKEVFERGAKTVVEKTKQAKEIFMDTLFK